MNRRNALRAMVLTPFAIASANFVEAATKDLDFLKTEQLKNEETIHFGNESISNILFSFSKEITLAVFNFNGKKQVSLNKSSLGFCCNNENKSEIFLVVNEKYKDDLKQMEKSGIPQCKCYILHKFEDSIIAVGYKEAIEDLMYEQMDNQAKNIIHENGKRIESFNLEFDVANFKGVIKSVPRFV